MVLLISNVFSAVEPPAPQVISIYAGLSAAILSIRLYRLSKPKSVLGGKNSKL